MRAAPPSSEALFDEFSAARDRRRRRKDDPVVRALVEENAALRREVARLETFRTLAYRDALTGLWNRRYFDERLAEELHRAGRDPSRRFSVLAIDVNDLKIVNDRHGHAAGDQVLVLAAQFLRDTLRTYDICCRVGGDEFAAIFPEVGPAACAALVGRLRRALDRANDGRRLPLGLSFGSSSYPEQGTSLAAIVGRADEAMYRDKRRQKQQADGPALQPPSAR